MSGYFFNGSIHFPNKTPHLLTYCQQWLISIYGPLKPPVNKSRTIGTAIRLKSPFNKKFTKSGRLVFMSFKVTYDLIHQ